MKPHSKLIVLLLLISAAGNLFAAEWAKEGPAGSLNGSLWTPGRDANGIVTAASVALLPVDTWIEVANTKASEQIEPLLISGGYKPVGSTASMFIYSGMAFDPVKGKSYLSGGGHSGGGDNGIYSVDFYKMGWEVCAWPSKPGVDITLEEARMYINGSLGGNSYAPNVDTANPSAAGSFYVYPYAKSSTGFAVKLWNSETVWSWCEAVGPEGVRRGGQVLFPGGLIHGTQAAADYFNANNKLGRESLRSKNPNYDVLPDGRPTSRHQYNGFIYNPARQEVQSVVRSFTRAKLDGSGWVSLDSGGYASYPDGKVHMELTWTAVDDSSGEIWTGGCGSDCWVSNYMYYRGALVYNPANNTFKDSPRMNRYEWGAANCGVTWAGLSVLSRGRWLIGASNKATDFWGLYNMSTQEKRSLRVTGSPFVSTQSEGNAFVYLSDRDQVWAFDPTKKLECTVVDLAAMTPNSLYPGESFDVPAYKKSIANSNLISISNTLVYNRLRYWDKEKMLVFVNDHNKNIWVCKVGTANTSITDKKGIISSGALSLTAKPNPFNPATTISFSIENAGIAGLRIYTLDGKLAKHFNISAGQKKVMWDGCDETGNRLSSGTYIMQLTAGDKKISKALVFSR
ncbi:MAG: T9SS type A sorting domain-containing protein [Fibrobacteres bacterium]|nr:T9SS type A sorting domain-containing protein [Fibrobacterota bacterium]